MILAIYTVKHREWLDGLADHALADCAVVGHAVTDCALTKGLDLRVSEHREMGWKIKLDKGECIYMGTLFWIHNLSFWRGLWKMALIHCWHGLRVLGKTKTNTKWNRNFRTSMVDRRINDQETQWDGHTIHAIVLHRANDYEPWRNPEDILVTKVIVDHWWKGHRYSSETSPETFLEARTNDRRCCYRSGLPDNNKDHTIAK